MQRSNQRLNSFISDVTRGQATPIPEGEDTGGERVGSGQIAEIDNKTYQFYMNGNVGPPKMQQEDWFVFSDARTVKQPGILFWQKGGKYFARRLDGDAWEKFLKVAKVKKTSW